MSTINFNLKNKDQVQIKNEILNKMSKIRESYNIDSNYHELFFNLVQNSNDKNNLKLSINKHGNYSLKTVGGNPSNGNGNATVTGNVNPNTASEKSVFNDIGKIIPNANNLNPFSGPSKKSGHEEEGGPGDEVQRDEEEAEEAEVGPDVVSGEGPVVHDEEGESGDEKELVEEEEMVDVSSLSDSQKNQLEKDKNCLINPGMFSFTKKCPPKIPKSEVPADQSMMGGYSDSEYDSDDSLFSSDDEAEDIIPYTTAVFDDDEDDDMMDHIRNMRSKKYLKNLNNTQLRDILKTNNQKITTGGSYLTKEQMVKSIKKYYK